MRGLAGQAQTLQRHRGAIGQRIERLVFGLGQRRADADAEHAERPLRRCKRQEAPGGRRHGRGASASRLALFHAPPSRRQGGFIKFDHAFWRCRGLRADDEIVPDLDQHRRQGGDPGALLGEFGEQFGLGSRRPERAAEAGDAAETLDPRLCRSRFTAHPARHRAGDHGDAEKDEDRDDVLGVADGKDIKRRDEEKIPREKTEHGGKQGDAQTMEAGRDDDGGEKQHPHRLFRDGAHHFADHGDERDQRRAGEPGPDAKRRARPADGLRCADRARRDMDGEGVRPPRQRLREPAPGKPPPPSGAAAAEHDLRDIAPLGFRECLAKNIAAGQRFGFGAELDRERKRGAEIDDFARLLDMHGKPRRPQRCRQSRRVPHHRLGIDSVATEQRHDPLARRPRPGDRFGAHIARDIGIDMLRRPPQRHFAQGGEIAFAKKPAERPLRRLRRIDPPLDKPRPQLRRREIDHLDVGGEREHAVGDGLGDAHAGDAGDGIVQALEMLDIEGRPDIDPGVQQFDRVFPAFGMTAAGDVGVGEFVEQEQLRAAGERAIEVEFLDLAPAIGELSARQHREIANLRDGLAASVGFDQPGDNVNAVLALAPRRGQHLPGLADPGGHAKKDLEPPLAFARRGQRQSVGIGAAIIIGRARHAAEYSGKLRRRQLIESAVEREHVHPRLADEAEERLLGMGGNEIGDTRLGEMAGARDAGNLPARIFR